jgi:hypothetical protein
MSSKSILFALSLRAFARLRTCAATLCGKLTLCRTGLDGVLITPLCIKKVRRRIFPPESDGLAQWRISGACGIKVLRRLAVNLNWAIGSSFSQSLREHDSLPFSEWRVVRPESGTRRSCS